MAMAMAIATVMARPRTMGKARLRKPMNDWKALHFAESLQRVAAGRRGRRSLDEVRGLARLSGLVVI